MVQVPGGSDGEAVMPMAYQASVKLLGSFWGQGHACSLQEKPFRPYFVQVTN